MFSLVDLVLKSSNIIGILEGGLECLGACLACRAEPNQVAACVQVHILRPSKFY
jgi:hypothetical protein